jgi:hypothetical protein
MALVITQREQTSSNGSKITTLICIATGYSWVILIFTGPSTIEISRVGILMTHLSLMMQLIILVLWNYH